MNRPFPIVLYFDKLDLNWFSVAKSTVDWSKLFHLLTTVWENTCCLTDVKHLCFKNFIEWPLVVWSDSTSLVKPLIILNTLIISVLFLLSSKVHNPSAAILSSYGLFFTLGINLVNLCWTFSMSCLSQIEGLRKVQKKDVYTLSSIQTSCNML